jgi:formylglycine-generating enzyme required for sulfatase activity
MRKLFPAWVPIVACSRAVLAEARVPIVACSRAVLAEAMRKLFPALVLVAAFLMAAAPAEARRVALVLGNSDYQTLSKLENPVTDAKAIAAELKSHGFDVFEHYDLARADLLDALEQFQSAADQSTVALVYYAGHGMEIGGKNVIAPTDIEVSCEPKEARRAVELDKLFSALGRASQQVVLLDACRNDPFPQCPTRSARSGSGFRGISVVSEEDRSLLIATSTLSGQLAADGAAGAHSPFAAALLARFKASPRSYMRDLLDQTARDVQIASNGSQVPEVTTRGGAPKVCLDENGCGDSGLPAEAGADSEATVAEVRSLLAGLGYGAGARGQDAEALAGAIRKFQSNAGLPPDGRITGTLLAVLRATKMQMASLPKGEPGGGGGGAVIEGPLEHEAGSTFKDCEDCPEMVAVPAGEFTMGSPPADPDKQASELPPHNVRIGHGFAVSKFEVTFDQWDACALEGGCNGYMPKDGGWGRGRRPAIYVSWDDAKSYVDYLRQKTGKPYRLLSEAEWEYAARAGTTSRYATGNAITTADADFDDSAAKGKRGNYEGKTVDVGTFPPNPYGLFDMHGNVWEWVEDCWNKSHAGAPSDGSPRGGDCSRRVLKGGAWYFEAAFLRAAARLSYPKMSRLNVAGFRVARPLE